MQTSDHFFVETHAQVGVLGDGESAVVVVGHDKFVGIHLLRVADVAILKSLPLGFIGADGPVETWVERAVGGALSLEEVVKPRRC